MIELLAVPCWNTPPIHLAAWVEALQNQGLAAVVVRDSPQGSWIEVNALRFRGYALMNGIKVEAVNFELTAPDPTPARLAIETAVAALAWEIDEDNDVEDDDDDD